MVAHASNPSTRETEAGKSVSSCPPGLCSEFQASHGYIETTYLKKIRTNQRNICFGASAFDIPSKLTY